MASSGFMWECSCGNIEYGDEEPEECFECHNIGTYIKMPEEIVEEREKELIEEIPKIKKKKGTKKK